VVRLFFLLSGEHETLPYSEVKAILEAENQNFRVLEVLDQVLRLEADIESINAIKFRAAYTKLCCLELAVCDTDLNQIIKTIRNIDLSNLLDEEETFAVRVKHVKNYAEEISSTFLERILGGIILQEVEGTRVSLEKPDKTFIGILTGNKLLFGLKIAEISPKSFTGRLPKNKPFVHPSTMTPKLARCMVNLSRAKAGSIVLDPFCGTGSILIEAALIGCRILGTDIQRIMVKGALRNFLYFGIDPEGVIVADAKNLPIKSVDFVVADPPYGRSATTMKRTTKQIIEDTLKDLHPIIKSGGYVCMAAPKEIHASDIGRSTGYEHIESHFVYVHRSLTREIVVLRRK